MSIWSKSFFVILKFSFVKEVSKRRFICQLDAQYLKNFVRAPIQLHVVLNNCDQAVGAYSSVDLYPNGILGSTSKLFDFEVLLQPFEKQFHLSSFFVKFSNLKGRNVCCIR